MSEDIKFKSSIIIKIDDEKWFEYDEESKVLTFNYLEEDEEWVVFVADKGSITLEEEYNIDGFLLNSETIKKVLDMIIEVKR